MTENEKKVADAHIQSLQETMSRLKAEYNQLAVVQQEKEKEFLRVAAAHVSAVEMLNKMTKPEKPEEKPEGSPEELK